MTASAKDRTDRLKLAFVGCGAISSMHLLGIREGAAQIEVTAAVDTNLEHAKAVAEQTGAAVYSSLDQALAEGDFGAVDLMLPHHLHEDAAVAAFEAGKHELLEKPMAPTPDACERILAAAARAAGESGCVFMVAENAQYWPEVVTARRLIEDGAIVGTTVRIPANRRAPAARGPGVSTAPSPEGASPSTPVPTGSARCACGSARSTR